MSGGEKSAAIHLPLFAAANALYPSAKDHCPRMIALDEAFVGIDERYKPDLFGPAVKFDLVLNLPAEGAALAEWLTGAARLGVPFYVTLHQLITLPVTIRGAVVQVCENPAVLRHAAAEL